jgi:hypothetical protein
MEQGIIEVVTGFEQIGETYTDDDISRKLGEMGIKSSKSKQDYTREYTNRTKRGLVKRQLLSG